LGQSLPTSANGSVAPLAPDPSAALRTIRALNDEAFDIIHLHEPIVPGPTVTSLLLRLAPTVGTFHAAGDSSSYRVLNKTARWAANHLSARVAVSEAARELASRYLDGDYQVLFNGIETARYLKADAVRETEPTIFFCGRFEPRKGLEALLGAMKYLPQNFALWIAADGPGIDEMHRLYESDTRISWLGRITETDKLDRLSRCSVFCAPSLRGESFGIVLLEAMAAAAPLVTTDIDGYRNVATHELNALLVAPGDEEQLAKSLTRIVNDTNLSQRLVAGGLKRAEDFSMQRLAKEYVLIYERLLAAEKNDEIVVQPNKLLSMFEHRVLRRPQVGQK
jgi:phosphatidylinositol alpha-mannosyltransferase